jgi:hypothetical protein
MWAALKVSYILFVMNITYHLYVFDSDAMNSCFPLKIQMFSHVRTIACFKQQNLA